MWKKQQNTKPSQTNVNAQKQAFDLFKLWLEEKKNFDQMNTENNSDGKCIVTHFVKKEKQKIITIKKKIKCITKSLHANFWNAYKILTKWKY